MSGFSRCGTTSACSRRSTTERSACGELPAGVHAPDADRDGIYTRSSPREAGEATARELARRPKECGRGSDVYTESLSAARRASGAERLGLETSTLWFSPTPLVAAPGKDERLGARTVARCRS